MSVQLSTVQCGMQGREIINRAQGRMCLTRKSTCLKVSKDFCASICDVPQITTVTSKHGKHVSLESKARWSPLDEMKWDEKGLVVAMAQNVDTGAILMQGFVNEEALAATISTRRATFYSRSRSTMWTKGETSSNFITVDDIFLDCDGDSIIYLGHPHGPSCHTGSKTCYYKSILNPSQLAQLDKENTLALTTMYSLEYTIASRKAELARSRSQAGKPSWTRRLLLDHKLLCSKIREEAEELCCALEEDEDSSRVASEMADVLYHAMVLLALKDVTMEDVLQVLRQRFSESGIEEKMRRSSPLVPYCGQ